MTATSADGVRVLDFGRGHSFGMLGLLVRLGDAGEIVPASDAVHRAENLHQPMALPGSPRDEPPIEGDCSGSGNWPVPVPRVGMGTIHNSSQPCADRPRDGTSNYALSLFARPPKSASQCCADRNQTWFRGERIALPRGTDA